MLRSHPAPARVLIYLISIVVLVFGYTFLHKAIFDSYWFDVLLPNRGLSFSTPDTFRYTEIEPLEPQIFTSFCRLTSSIETSVSARDYHCPLVLDLDGNDRFETIALGNTVFPSIFFDFEGDRFKENTTWLQAPDGFLARDSNFNGEIDSGSELFSDQTRSRSGELLDSGFKALKDLDVNGDNQLNSSDPVWLELFVWVDSNLDGRSTEQELHSLPSIGIESISTNYITNFDITRASNPSTPMIGEFTKENGESLKISNIELYTNKSRSQYLRYISATEEAFRLPNIPGRGEIHNLQSAMSLDSILREMVVDFSNTTNRRDWPQLAEVIFLRWAGVEKDTTIMLDELQRYQFDTLNKLYGNEYPTTPSKKNEVAMLVSNYNFFFEQFYADLLIGTHLEEIFDLITYNYTADNYRSSNLDEVIEHIDRVLQMNRSEGLGLLTDFHRVFRGKNMDNNINYEEFRTHYLAMGDDVIWAFASAGNVDSIQKDGPDHYINNTGNAAMFGSERSEHFTKLQRGHASIWAGDGNDTIDFQVSEVYLDRRDLEHYVFAGEGNNQVYLVDAYIFLFAGNGANTVNVSEGVSQIILGNGNNTVSYNEANSRINTSVGNQHTLSVGAGEDQIFINNDGLYNLDLGDGKDKVTAFSGDTNITTGKDDDAILIHAGKHFVTGGTGNEVIEIEGGTLTLAVNLGDGIDRVFDKRAASERELQIWLPAGIETDDIRFTFLNDELTLHYGDRGDAIEFVDFGLRDLPHNAYQLRFSNSLYTSLSTAIGIEPLIQAGTEKDDLFDVSESPQNEILNGFGGNDELRGSAHSDTLDGGEGDDTLYGGDGDDTYVFSYNYQNDIIWESSGKDRIILGAGIDPDDVIIGKYQDHLILRLNETGDRLEIGSWFSSDQYKVESIEFANGDKWDIASLERFAQIGSEGKDTLVGTMGADTLYGTGGNDTLYARQGDDMLFGGDGDDVLDGADGNDVLDGGRGKDFLAGGKGNDIYIVDSLSDVLYENLTLEEQGSDTVMSFQSYTLKEGFENLTLLGRNDIHGKGNKQDNTIVGNEGNNELNGFSGDDVIQGGAGHDTLWGNDGDDKLFGGQGDDVLYGGEGDDTLEGGNGDDTLIGGPGNDLYNITLSTGNITISDVDSTPGNNDTIHFGTDLLEENTQFIKIESDLKIVILNIDLHITLKNFYRGADAQIESISFANQTVFDLRTVAPK